MLFKTLLVTSLRVILAAQSLKVTYFGGPHAIIQIVEY